jgi:hypothetical protein
MSYQQFEEFQNLPIDIQSQILSQYPQTLTYAITLSKPLKSGTERYYSF